MKAQILLSLFLLAILSLNAQRKQELQLRCNVNNANIGDTLTCSVTTILEPKTISLVPEELNQSLKVLSTEFQLSAQNDTVLERNWTIQFQFVQVFEYPIDSMKAIVSGASTHNTKEGPVLVSKDWNRYSNQEKEEFVEFVDKTLKPDSTYRIDMNSTHGLIKIEGRGAVRALNQKEQRKLRKLMKKVRK